MKNLEKLSKTIPGIRKQIKEIINGVIEEGNTVILVKFEGVPDGKTTVRRVRNAPSNVKILIDFDNLFIYKNGIRYCFPEDVARIIAQRLGNIEEIKEIYSGIMLRSRDEETGVLGFTFIEPGRDDYIDVPFEKDSITESRKPFEENEVTYPWISQYVHSKGFEVRCASESLYNPNCAYEFDEGFYITKDGENVGYVVNTPAEYYLAGENEDYYFEGNNCREFMKDFEEAMAGLTLTESRIRESEEDNVRWTSEIESAMDAEGIWVRELVVFPNDQGILQAEYDIHGDWKHDHIASKIVMEDLGWELIDKQTEPSGEDSYWAHYVYINTESAQCSVNARASEGYLSDEEGNPL